MPTIRMTDPTKLIVISGCCSGGKSTLLQELARRRIAHFNPHAERQRKCANHHDRRKGRRHDP